MNGVVVHASDGGAGGGAAAAARVHPLDALVWLANTSPWGLAEGTRVLTGSLTTGVGGGRDGGKGGGGDGGGGFACSGGFVPVKAGDEVRAVFEGLGELVLEIDE